MRKALRLFVLVIAAVIGANGAAHAACQTSLPSPFALRSTGTITGTILGLIFDPACKYIYAINDRHRVDFFSVERGVWEAPISSISSPEKIEVSPDGRTLYVGGDSGSGRIYVIDLVQRRLTKTITIALNGQSPDARATFDDFVVTDTGAVLVSTTVIRQ
jgi:YVTN family beta-propeller protein